MNLIGLIKSLLNKKFTTTEALKFSNENIYFVL